MTNDQRREILNKAKDFFREVIAKNHIKNTKKLVDLSEFNINPFLCTYLANFLTGNNNPESIAKALVYPRVLGTSITTSFGNNLQRFCSSILEGFKAKTPGLDIEFIDQIDGRRKYCQIKAGPNTINKDDVETIFGHFKSARNLFRTNFLNVGIDDLVVGVLYGTQEELSGHYRKIATEYPVYVGKDFWHRLTGESDFYYQLINAIGEVAKEADAAELVDSVIKKIAKQLENK